MPPLLSPPQHPVVLKENRHCVFFCFDANYRVPALVAVLGALRHLAMRIDIVLFVPEDEAPRWQLLAQHLDEPGRLTRLLVLCCSTHRVPSAREAYGFKSKRKLSRTAFGRLYATRELQRRGYQRALYLDTDIAVLNDFTMLFSLPMVHALSAFSEPPKGQILEAIELHHITNGQYFNSGVMLFNLQHPDLEHLINGAIGYAEDVSVRLLYHDQCALNRMIRGHYHALPDKYNFFIRPGLTAPEYGDDTIILHFVDSPKPWEHHYPGLDAKSIWSTQWHITERYLQHLNINPAGWAQHRG